MCHGSTKKHHYQESCVQKPHFDLNIKTVNVGTRIRPKKGRKLADCAGMLSRENSQKKPAGLLLPKNKKKAGKSPPPGFVFGSKFQRPQGGGALYLGVKMKGTNMTFPSELYMFLKIRTKFWGASICEQNFKTPGVGLYIGGDLFAVLSIMMGNKKLLPSIIL